MRRSSGSIAFYLILLLVIGASVALSMVPDFPENTVKAENNCLDYDPPNTADTVRLNDVTYNLIKKDAGIASSKIGEMTKVGEYNGRDIYILVGTNYYNDLKLKESIIIYVLNREKNNYHYFDIYIKDGVPIPESIKNSKSYGGNGGVQVIIDDTSQYPPQGFNTADIIGLNAPISKPAYIYGNNKVTSAYVNGLSGVRQIGSLATSEGNRQLYFHLDFIFMIDGQNAFEYIPTDSPVDFSQSKGNNKTNMQMRFLNVRKVEVNPVCWYTPSCKPVIYLYPPQKTDVSVRVKPKGYFTFTKPEYSEANGWQVTAYPDGRLETAGAQYPYLYYETKLESHNIDVPTRGYIRPYQDLPALYDRILPKLGLNNKELIDFKEYWNKALPPSPYYFVGILNRDNIDEIERLTISPVPAQTIRVRLYFEPTDPVRLLPEPDITPVERNTKDFTLVEWGGIVHSNGDYSCSQ